MLTQLLCALLVCCLAVPLTGCRAETEAETGEVTASVADPAAAVPEMAPALDTAGAWRPEERATLPSAQIYYTLTDFGWYARGEPLLHEGRAFVPAGMPITASLEEMAQAGEYEGVQYYMRRADEVARLYVPVFEGYWLVFQPDSASAGARPADPTSR